MIVTGVSGDRKVIEIESDENDWGLESMNHKNAAVYGNGETDRLPLTGTGTRKIVAKNNSTITLEQPLGPEVTI